MASKYFPTTGAIASAPAEFFKEIEYDEFMDWRVLNWDMPDSVVCMIRAENVDTGHIKEYVYQRRQMHASVCLNSRMRTTSLSLWQHR